MIFIIFYFIISIVIIQHHQYLHNVGVWPTPRNDNQQYTIYGFHIFYLLIHLLLYIEMSQHWTRVMVSYKSFVEGKKFAKIILATIGSHRHPNYVSSFSR